MTFEPAVTLVNNMYTQLTFDVTSSLGDWPVRGRWPRAQPPTGFQGAIVKPGGSISAKFPVQVTELPMGIEWSPARWTLRVYTWNDLLMAEIPLVPALWTESLSHPDWMAGWAVLGQEESPDGSSPACRSTAPLVYRGAPAGEAVVTGGCVFVGKNGQLQVPDTTITFQPSSTETGEG